MILMRANPLQGPLEGVGPDNHYVWRHINNRYILLVILPSILACAINQSDGCFLHKW